MPSGWSTGRTAPRTVTTSIHCADYYDRRDQALLARHPDRPGRHVLPGAAGGQQRVWPTEEYEAALSYVPVVPIEDDLFAGLGDVASADALATKGASSSRTTDGRTPREHPQHRGLAGPGAFIAFFVLAIALWLLMRNMNARMRRMSYQAEERREAEAEARGVPAGEADGPEGRDAGEQDHTREKDEAEPTPERAETTPEGDDGREGPEETGRTRP